ncbi:DUF3516 domain-containing protein [Nocardioides ungokensis]|uniref:DUF3516 domain-containing protein n=1 Tax=Nocardioides ungokensis TaxID=1643322 RepID=UPI003CCE41A9
MIEAVLEGPRQILFAQQHAARGEAIAEMKAHGIEYDERLLLLEEVTWPQPLAELLEATYEIYRGRHPWLPEDALSPKSVVREMFEQGMSFTDFVSRYQLARSEGLVLRYLTDAYRTLRQTVPEDYRTPELEDLVEWLGETVRQTDSSLLDEWEALTDPGHVRPDVAHHEPPPPPRPISRQERAFRVMGPQCDVPPGRAGRTRRPRRADGPGAFRRRPDRATARGGDDTVGVGRGDRGLLRRARHPRTSGDARGPSLLEVEPATGQPVGAGEDDVARLWRVRQTLDDPEGHHDWVIDAVADLDASDTAGELVLATVAMRRL